MCRILRITTCLWQQMLRHNQNNLVFNFPSLQLLKQTMKNDVDLTYILVFFPFLLYRDLGRRLLGRRARIGPIERQQCRPEPRLPRPIQRVRQIAENDAGFLEGPPSWNQSHYWMGHEQSVCPFDQSARRSCCGQLSLRRFRVNHFYLNWHIGNKNFKPKNLD